MKFILVFIFVIFFSYLQAQTNTITGRVEDGVTHEVLSGTSILVFGSPVILGGITSSEGKFSIHTDDKIDSIKFSMIGYQSKIYRGAEISGMSFRIVKMDLVQTDLQEVVVHPLSALEIVKQAAQRIQSMIPSKDFESRAFYREIIRDSTLYYSVAEAIFKIQFAIDKKTFKLQMDKDRSKEDVAYTRLFEDFHPGGSPEDATSQSFVIRLPDFLTENNLKNYTFRKDSTIQNIDQFIYVIDFDQKPNI